MILLLLIPVLWVGACGEAPPASPVGSTESSTEAAAREPAARESSASDFETFIAALDGSAEEQDAALATYVGEHGPTPLVEMGAGGPRAIFVVRDADLGAAAGAAAIGAAEPQLYADFNGWGWEDVDDAERRLAPVGESGWRWLARELDAGSRVEYTYVVAQELYPDPYNPRRVPGWQGDVSVFTIAPRSLSLTPQLEALLTVEDGSPELPLLDKARRWSFDHESAFLPGTRRAVHVYRPPGDPQGPLPTVYFGDGTLYWERGRVPQMLDALVASGRIQPLVAVFVDPVDRHHEYRRHSGYRRMMVEEIVPLVDRRYETLEGPAGRLVVGGSRGALAAVDLAHTHPQVFGHVAALAPATSPTDLISSLAASPRAPLSVYVLIGRYDRRWAPDGYALASTLRQKGYDPTVVEVPEGHSLTAWRLRLPAVLEHFFPGPAARR